MALRVAVIGCGVQGRVHLDYLARMSDVEIAAVCDRDPARQAAAQREFGARAAFDDYRRLLDEDRYDLVAVCVMPVDHQAVVLAALERGAHVLCEKPFAINATEAAAMVAAARAAGRILTVGTNMRFLDNARLIKERIEAGDLGEHVYTRAFTYSAGIPWWGRHYTRAISGGGVLASTAVHILDCALHLAGFPTPATVSATTARLYPGRRGGSEPPGVPVGPYDVEDLVSAFIRFADGTALSLEGTWTYDRPESRYSLEFTGTKGTARLAPLELYVDRAGSSANVTPSPEPGTDWSESVGAEIADVIAAIREGREPTITAEQALAVQLLADTIYESARVGREVACIAQSSAPFSAARKTRQQNDR